MPEDHSTFNIQRSTLIKLLTILVLAMTLYAYRNLLPRPFAADDFEWLLNVRDRDLGAVLLRGFDPRLQHHFYRPLVWLLLWAEYQLFGQNPTPYHIVSLGLHLANAGLLAGLIHRGQQLAEMQNAAQHSAFALIPNSQALIPILMAALFALHPAPFEAVVWISAQSELLGAFLLLLTLHLWLAERPWVAFGSLALALLSKESTIIALLLMPLLRPAWRQLLPHALLGIGYLLLQVFVGQRNSVLRAGEYGIGPHMLTNPLRSLALLLVPLPNTEHADAAWLVPVGVVLALLLAALALYALRRGSSIWRWVLALALTLAPTAPFVSPPDSRYLYVPGAIVLLGLSLWSANLLNRTDRAYRLKNNIQHSAFSIQHVFFVLIVTLMLFYCAGELLAREMRFAAASGPGGSLWQLASKICADVQPGHMLLVDAPLAPPHAIAIVQLSCSNTQPILISRDQLSTALRPASVVISFPGGRAEVESWH